MFSTRFKLPVVLTTHAKLRMIERQIDEVLLLEIIDTGHMKLASESHYWLFKHIHNRPDICSVLRP